MKKIFLALLLLTIFAGCSVDQATTNTADSAAAKFAVYLTDTNQLVFSDEDIKLYDASTHTFTLTEDGANKMKEYQTTTFQTTLKMDTGLYQKPFAAKLGDEEIYGGKFWTNLSSMSESGIVILDVAIVGSEYNTLTVASGYPSPELSPENEKKINDPRIAEHFRKTGKLK